MFAFSFSCRTLFTVPEASVARMTGCIIRDRLLAAVDNATNRGTDHGTRAHVRQRHGLTVIHRAFDDIGPRREIGPVHHYGVMAVIVAIHVTVVITIRVTVIAAVV